MLVYLFVWACSDVFLDSFKIYMFFLLLQNKKFNWRYLLREFDERFVTAVFPERGLGPTLFSFGPPVAEASWLATEMVWFGFVLQAQRDCILYRYGTQM